ncbi:hypothetical protein CB1_000866001 [Camelus ferus]|nr:hypothetical protein CB1_000866001 [Camelus ferus]
MAKMSSAGLPKACTLVSSKAPGAGSPCFIYSTIICLSSPAVPVPRVSLPLLSRAGIDLGDDDDDNYNSEVTTDEN